MYKPYNKDNGNRYKSVYRVAKTGIGSRPWKYVI